MAQKSGLSQSQVSAFEAGKRNISSEHFELVLRAFEIDAREVFALLAGFVPLLERELRTGRAPGLAPPKPPPTHVLDEDGYHKKKREPAEPSASDTPPTIRPLR
jgi:transcriptional regulator with XRE-family HTH domain